MPIMLDLVNRTSRIRDARFAALLPSLQAQIDQDFLPAWGALLPIVGGPVTLGLVGKLAQPNPAHWNLWLLDNSDTPGDLGYHQADTGTPSGRIFVESDMLAGVEISVTISHEILETLADPLTNTMGPLIGEAQYIREVSDPVEADADGYSKLGYRVSNFVLPSYYQPGSPGPWDFRGKLDGPCPMLRPGGYAMYLKDNQWQSTMARYADGTLSPRAIRSDGRSARRAATA